jgi:hypothetical protein
VRFNNTSGHECLKLRLLRLVAAKPQKPKVKETFFQKLYKGNWRNIVVAGTWVLLSVLAIISPAFSCWSQRDPICILVSVLPLQHVFTF